MEFVKPSDEQKEAAKAAFKHNKELKEVFVTTDCQVFPLFDNANSHSRDIGNRDIAKIEKSESKDETEKKK